MWCSLLDNYYIYVPHNKVFMMFSLTLFQDLEAFGYRVNTLAKELENSDVYNRDCNIDDAWVIIDKFSKKLTVLENEAQVQNLRNIK